MKDLGAAVTFMARITAEPVYFRTGTNGAKGSTVTTLTSFGGALRLLGCIFGGMMGMQSANSKIVRPPAQDPVAISYQRLASTPPPIHSPPTHKAMVKSG